MMAAGLLLKNATIINEGLSFKGGIFVKNGVIADIFDFGLKDDAERLAALEASGVDALDLEGKWLAPGVIDTHVHFREPGATERGCIASESAAAVMGGVTSYLDMPNNTPPTTTAEAISNKLDIAGRDSWANYGFYMGATDSNIAEIERADRAGACAIKAFLGSTTGNLLLESDAALAQLLARSPLLVAAHCEDNSIIAANLAAFKERYGADIPFAAHPLIRSREACLASTKRAVSLALETGARLHILHVSTSEEVDYIARVKRTTDRISAEACVHYLWFDDSGYERFGARIKCNPAIKTAADRSALCDAVRSGIIDTVSTDHAPHLQGSYLEASGGIPLVQYSLLMMLEKVREGVFELPTVVERMSHAPARLYGIERRGFIRKGYYADLVVFDTAAPSDVPPASRCGWSPVTRFSSSILYTFVNGNPVFAGGRLAQDAPRGLQLTFTNR